MRKTFLVCAFISFLAGSGRGEKPYFQQSITYDIKADLDPQSAKIAGIETITYFNNSPDTLNRIYFHLYFNAFQPGSYLDRQDRESGDFRIANTPPRNQGSVGIDLLKIDGQEIFDYEIDNTIMTVPLARPLAPNDSTVFYLEFTSQIPARGSRTAHRGDHFDIGQWYPKPAVYDRYGWHAHQYLDYEFYADYADFSVELTLPAKYLVAHVGKLLNEEEIFGRSLPVPEGDTIIVDALRGIWGDTTGMSNPDVNLSGSSSAVDREKENNGGLEFAQRSDPSIVDFEQANRKTWKIQALNIHDFAFCADPDFIVDICRYNGVFIKSYYDKGIGDVWARNAAYYTRESLKFFSESYFPYPYGQYSVVASLMGGGMEYPQLTMVGRRSGRHDYSHGLESVIAHEVGHAWFYGILGFNETEQSFLDEGLTTFATNLYLEYRYGRYKNDFTYKKKWQRRLLPNGNERNNNQRLYIRRARILDEDPMITPANLFADGGRYYDASYEKASSVYFMLQYTLGDEKFDRFMHLLFQRWAYRHPYLSDLHELAEEVYGGDLDWFFRQWFTTTWSLDYSLDGIRRRNALSDGKPGYNTTISVGKHGRCISPLDVALYLKNGDIHTVKIPIEAWIDGQQSFDTTVFLETKSKKAILNPDERLADIDRLNNYSGRPPIRWQLLVPRFIFDDSYVEYFVDSYTIAHQPLLWYNSVDGISPGYSFFGSYLGEANKVNLKFDVGALNGHTDYNLGYENIITSLNPDIRYFLNSMEMDGRGRQTAGLFFWRTTGWRAKYLKVILAMRRNYMFERNYLTGDYWSPGDVNTIELYINRGARRRLSKTDLICNLISSIPGGNYDFTRLDLKFDMTIFGFARDNINISLRAGLANGEVPYQQRFFLSSADPYENWGSPFFRSRGTLPDEWKDEGRLFKPGGAGLSGYLERGLTGTRMTSLRIGRDLPPLNLPVRIPVVSRQLMRASSELYIVSGLVWQRKEEPKFRDFLSEAGLKITYEIPYLDRFVDENRLVMFLPLWLSDPLNDESEFEWRWLFSITP